MPLNCQPTKLYKGAKGGETADISKTNSSQQKDFFSDFFSPTFCYKNVATTTYIHVDYFPKQSICWTLSKERRESEEKLAKLTVAPDSGVLSKVQRAYRIFQFDCCMSALELSMEL